MSKSKKVEVKIETPVVAKVKTPVVAKAAKPAKESQQSIIYAELMARAKDNAISAGEIPAILAAVRSKFPKGTATSGYVGYVAAHKCIPAIDIVRTKAEKLVEVKAQKTPVAKKAKAPKVNAKAMTVTTSATESRTH
jgi:hypothetical protein